MSRFRWQAIFGAAVFIAVAPEVFAQRTLRDPHISFVYPAGGKVGTTFEVTVGGEFLEGLSEGFVSGGGVQVKVQKYFRHLTRGQNAGLRRRIDKARDRLIAANKKKGGSSDRTFTREELMKEVKYTEYELAQMADYQKRSSEPKRQLNPQLMEEVTLQITIDPKAALGERELRVITPTGMSNPMFFHVGKLPECRETEPNDTTPDSTVGDLLPVVINGQIMPGDVDRFSFKARKGMHLVIVASVRELIPYLADAVPGWFQGVLTLYDDKGKEVGFASSALGFRQDPVLFYEVPKDGEYVVEMRDSIYRGREDFVYRIVLGEIPYITGIFPLGGRASTEVNVEVHGWNLPVDKVSFEPIFDRGRAIRPFVLRQPDGMASNRVPFAVDAMTELMEQEPNNRREQAQSLTLPTIVNGRIDQPGDVDVFRFEGRSHEKLVAEVYARRLGSPMDTFLRLTDEKGRDVASNDDYEDKGLALSTHHADSRLVVSLPASGVFFLHVSDSQRKGGPEYTYRLQVRYPRPDFELRVVPSSVIGRPGTNVPITVYALRRDGHTDDITLDLDKPPAGFRISGGLVPGNQDMVRLTLSVPPTPTPEPINLELMGHSMTKGRKILHIAVPAEAMTQAFAYQHLVVAKDWSVMVSGRGTPADKWKPTVQFAREDKIKMTAGGTAKFRVLASRLPSELRLELSEPPEGITIKSITAEGDGIDVVVQTDAEKIKPGLRGNLLLNAFWEHTQTFKQSDDKKPRQVRQPIGMMPALPFEITGK